MNLVNMLVFESLRPKLAKRKVTQINQYFCYPRAWPLALARVLSLRLCRQIGHQDEPRVSTETSPQFAKAMTVLLLTLPGVALSYYGDELGMRNGHVTPPGDPAAHYVRHTHRGQAWLIRVVKNRRTQGPHVATAIS